MGLMDFLLGERGGTVTPSTQSSKTEAFSKSLNEPISPEEVSQFFSSAVESAGGVPSNVFPEFKFQRMAGGDIGKLEEALADVPIRRLEEGAETQRDRLMAGLRTRGIGDDPAALQLESELINRPLQTAIGDVLSQAAGTATGMQAGELSQLNPSQQQLSLQKFNAPRELFSDLTDLFSGLKGQRATSEMESESTFTGTGAVEQGPQKGLLDFVNMGFTKSF